MSEMFEKKKEKDRCLNERGYNTETLVESPEMKKKVSKRDVTVDDDQLVRITAFNNGPFSFFVHFVSNDDAYQKFQCDLQKLRNKLSPLRSIPPTGKTCIVDIKEHLYRAEIVQVGPKNGAMVQMLESGETAMVNLDKMFHLPPAIAATATFAKHYKLADFERSSTQNLLLNEIEFYFIHITREKLLTLKPLPVTGKIICWSSETLIQLLYRFRYNRILSTLR